MQVHTGSQPTKISPNEKISSGQLTFKLSNSTEPMVLELHGFVDGRS